MRKTIKKEIVLPSKIYGRMRESAHISGYAFQRAVEELRWLLEDERYKQIKPEYSNISNFLKDTADAFSLHKIPKRQKEELARLLSEVQPSAADWIVEL